MMRRREFITLLGGAAAAWPLAARAQQTERMRRIGVLVARPRTIREYQAWVGAFLQGLHAIGLDRRPQRADRHPLGHGQMPTTIRRHAAELAALAPDVIVARLAPQPRRRCCRRPAPCRSCSCGSSTRSAPVSSRAWRGRAATPLVSFRSNTV